MSEQWFERDPLWFKRAVFYEIHIRGFFDGNDDGSGDFRGLIEKLDFLQWLGVDCIWLLPMYVSPLRDGGYDIADFFTIHPDYGTVDDFREFVDQAHQRGMRVIADLVMNHTSNEHAWFQESRSDPKGPKGDWYVWSDTDEPYSEARIIFLDTETSNWTFDPVRGSVLLAPFLQPSARSELRQPGRAGRDAERLALLARSRDRRLPPRRGAVSLRARGHERREPPGDPRVPQARAGRGRRRVPGSRAARRGEPMAGGCRRVLRRWRRMPYGVPLPGDAAHVHVGAARGGDSDLRDPRPHAGDPGQRAVGTLPPQPRRVDARDGHRRGARLHVRRVRQGSADEDQPRHPPASRAAPRQRPRRDRVDARDPLLAAGLAGALLRRRDRHGRQRLSRRPRRRAHADAVDRRPQRGLLARRLGAAVPAAADGSGVRLPGGERRGAAAHADVAAALAAPVHRAAQGASGVRARHVRAAAPREHEDLCAYSPLGRGHRAVRAQSRALGPGRRARSLEATSVWSRRRCSDARASPRSGSCPIC